MKNVLKCIASLTVIALVCTGLLVLCNKFLPAQEIKVDYSMLLQGEADVVEVTAEERAALPAELNDRITDTFVRATSGDHVGAIVVGVTSTVEKFGTVFECLVGVESENGIANVLGAQYKGIVSANSFYSGPVSDPSNFAYFVGKNPEDITGMDLPAHAGATLTANAIVDAVRVAAQIAVTMGGGSPEQNLAEELFADKEVASAKIEKKAAEGSTKFDYDAISVAFKDDTAGLLFRFADMTFAVVDGKFAAAKVGEEITTAFADTAIGAELTEPSDAAGKTAYAALTAGGAQAKIARYVEKAANPNMALAETTFAAALAGADDEILSIEEDTAAAKQDVKVYKVTAEIGGAEKSGAIFVSTELQYYVFNPDEPVTIAPSETKTAYEIQSLTVGVLDSKYYGLSVTGAFDYYGDNFYALDQSDFDESLNGKPIGLVKVTAEADDHEVMVGGSDVDADHTIAVTGATGTAGAAAYSLNKLYADVMNEYFMGGQA